MNKYLHAIYVVAAMSAGLEAQATELKPLKVVELFTSQGCSSCPPADRLAAELTKRDDLLVLAFHVDYWNYLGWRDVFSDAQWTERQKLYAEQSWTGRVYTPQTIIQGQEVMVGSDRPKILQNLSKGSPSPEFQVRLREQSDAAFHVELSENPAGSVLELWKVVFRAPQAVPIQRGENAGETITYHQSVESVNRIGAWTGEPQSLELSDPGLDRGLALLVQEPELGKIKAGFLVKALELTH